LNKFLHEYCYKQKFPVIIEVSKKIAHFQKVLVHTGLTILDIAEKEEDTESHKIAELYEFLNDSSHD